MKILVTGANSYLASNIIKAILLEGYEVVALIRQNASIDLLKSIQEKIIFDVYEESFESLLKVFQKHKPNVVVHLASFFVAEHQSNQIDSLLDANIRFGLYLLEAMKETGVSKLINTGSSWQYYDNNRKGYSPVCLYAATKQAFEDLAFFYYEANYLSVLNLMLYDTYGPGDPRKKLFHLFKMASQSHEPILMSPGEQELNLVYIADVVKAYLSALKIILNSDKQFKNYAIRSNKTYPLRAIAELYSKVTQVELNIRWGGRPYRKREVMIPYLHLESLPNWEPTIALEQGIKLLIVNENY